MGELHYDLSEKQRACCKISGLMGKCGSGIKTVLYTKRTSQKCHFRMDSEVELHDEYFKGLYLSFFTGIT
jgi:hypothetical protein